MSSFRPPFMPRPFPMRPYEDDAYYKSRNSYFGERRHSLSGSLMSRHEPPIPFPSHDPAGSDPGQIPYPTEPGSLNFVRHGGPSTSPTSSSRTSDYGERVQAMPRNSNPFECSNEELVKKMISSWIPEEDIRKHAQITEPGLNPFSLIVRCVDRILFSLVDWAKSSVFFRDMSTEDQMSLLHETWSELVLLDHIYRQVWFSDDQNILLVSGKSIALAEIQGVFDDTGCKVFDRVADMTTKFRQVRIDRTELCCLKFLILFNAKDSKIQNHQFMTKVSERINSCLLEYVYSNYPNQADRFLQLLMRLPDVRALSNQVEQWLNDKFMAGLIGPNTLVAEMLNVRFQKNM